jgi:hypothetical protein
LRLSSQNPWARRITEKRPYRMLVELHSGIPATKTAAQEQTRLISRIERELSGQKIHFLSATSTSELSKYFRKPGNPIFVRYDNHYSQTSFIPLERCTDLFERYSEKRSIRRLYVEPERYSECRWQGRGAPLRYEEDSGADGQGGTLSGAGVISLQEGAASSFRLDLLNFRLDRANLDWSLLAVLHAMSP